MIQPWQLKEMKSILCFKVYKLIFQSHMSYFKRRDVIFETRSSCIIIFRNGQNKLGVFMMMVSAVLKRKNL